MSRDKAERSAGAEPTVRVVRHLPIPMADGVHLSATMVIPEGEGPFPAVFDYYPYRKDDLSADSLRRHHYLARHGYAALRVDVRGTGSSQGVAEDEYTLQEQLDGVAAIAFLADRPWCNGNVGMFGTSYGGFNSLQVAMHRPPALKAICPMYFTDNRYTDDCHYKGGALQMLYDMATYGLSMVVENALPPYPEALGEAWAGTWDDHLQAEPWLLKWLSSQTYNDYWKHGSLCEAYGAIECAAFLIGGWRDGYTNCNLRTFSQLQGPRKLLIGPWLHAQPDVGVPGPRIDHLYEMVRFFDYWLKGIDNGVMDEPPIALYVQQYDEPEASRSMTSGAWRYLHGWPLPGQAQRAFYPTADGALVADEAPAGGVAGYRYNPTVGTTFPMFSAASPYLLPVDQRLEEPYTVGWTSAPLEGPLEIVGRPEARLKVAVSAEIATVVLRLIDVAPDGTAALLTKGVLNLTHRASHEAPSILEPGKAYDVAVRLDATAWRFEPGHRIRLTLAGADFPNSWPSPYAYEAEVTLGEATSLTLPLLPPAGEGDEVPDFREPAPFTPVADVQEAPPVWRVIRNQMARTVSVELASSWRTFMDEALWLNGESETLATVYEQAPARATVKSEQRVVLHWPQRVIDTRARGQIESTADAFHVTIHLAITMDGMPHREKKWVRTIARHLL
ncbi:MAG: CocE/NonD family hydrolase [Candidatus Promineifilaceae bacterium]|nr:CocE/NonD family hydrolase [Candidatus Promineifilaceae bacterium]